MLTPLAVHALKPREKPYKVRDLADCPGFAVQVSPMGTKAFVLGYTLGGRRRWMTLGRFPEISLAEARKRCREARALVSDGIDPQAEKEERAAREQERLDAIREDRRKSREARETERNTGTLNDLFELYLKWAPIAESTRATIRKTIAKDIEDGIGRKPARAVTADDIAETLQQVWDRGATPRHLHAYLRTVYRWGLGQRTGQYRGKVARFRLESNPVSEIPPPKDYAPRERSLTADELVSVLERARAFGPVSDTALALEMLIWTGARVREVLGITAAEITLDPVPFMLPGGRVSSPIWTLPIDRVKTRRKRPLPHVVPLSEPALRILRPLAKERPTGTLLRASRDPSRPLSELVLLNTATAYAKALGIPHFTPRDLRRTFKTLAGSEGAGCDRFAVDVLQQHGLTGIARTHYDRALYIQEKTAAVNRWAEWLEGRMAEQQEDELPEGVSRIRG